VAELNEPSTPWIPSLGQSGSQRTARATLEDIQLAGALLASNQRIAQAYPLSEAFLNVIKEELNDKSLNGTIQGLEQAHTLEAYCRCDTSACSHITSARDDLLKLEKTAKDFPSAASRLRMTNTNDNYKKAYKLYAETLLRPYNKFAELFEAAELRDEQALDKAAKICTQLTADIQDFRELTTRLQPVLFQIMTKRMALANTHTTDLNRALNAVAPDAALLNAAQAAQVAVTNAIQDAAARGLPAQLQAGQAALVAGEEAFTAAIHQAQVSVESAATFLNAASQAVSAADAGLALYPQPLPQQFEALQRVSTEQKRVATDLKTQAQEALNDAKTALANCEAAKTSAEQAVNAQAARAAATSRNKKIAAATFVISGVALIAQQCYRLSQQGAPENGQDS
jgi:hypothetical protein